MGVELARSLQELTLIEVMDLEVRRKINVSYVI
jgi:hypothetical protein